MTGAPLRARQGNRQRLEEKCGAVIDQMQAVCTNQMQAVCTSYEFIQRLAQQNHSPAVSLKVLCTFRMYSKTVTDPAA